MLLEVLEAAAVAMQLQHRDALCAASSHAASHARTQVTQSSLDSLSPSCFARPLRHVASSLPSLLPASPIHAQRIKNHQTLRSAALPLCPSLTSPTMAAKDLTEFIDWSNLECLNEQPQHAAANVLKQGYREDDGLYLESDTDEQLLINIHFQQKVRISSITFKAPGDGHAPKHVKLFTNRMSLGFSDADSVPCAEQLELTPKQLEEGQPIPLKLTKFNNVTILSILVDSNQGDEETTKLFKIALGGTAFDSFNVAAIQKVEDKS